MFNNQTGLPSLTCSPPHKATGHVAKPCAATTDTHICTSHTGRIGTGAANTCSASDASTQDKQVVLSAEPATLLTMDPYNPAAALPRKVVKRILALEFVEMADLRADIWLDDTNPQDGSSQPRRQPVKPPVNDISVWLECYAHMEAVLTTRFPEKATELWAYQTTIVKAAHTYEGSNWVSYDRQYHRDRLARKDLNWSVPNTRL